MPEPDGTSTTTSAEPAGSTTTDATTTGDATGTGSRSNGGDTERRYSQAEVDAILKERLDRAKRKADEETERRRQQEEQDRAKQQGEWQKLAEQHEARVKELEPVVAKADRYEAALKTHLEAQRKDLPAHITALLDRLDVAEQLEWLSANAEAIRPQTTASTNGHTTAAAVTATPKAANGQAVATQQQQDHRQAFKDTALTLWGKRG